MQKAEWVLKINLSRLREAQIQSCFNCSIKFHYLKNVDELDNLLEEFKKNREDTIDDNKLNAFASFLIVSRKFKYSLVYIFHIIYPEKSIWKVILPQTKHFNSFPGSVQQFNVLKILSANCNCIGETASYLPQNSFWLNRFFVDLANRNQKICLTLDCLGINPNGLGKYRTKADNLEEQTCYFNLKNKDKLLNALPSKRIRNSEAPNDKKFIFKLNELDTGSEILTRGLMLVLN